MTRFGIDRVVEDFAFASVLGGALKYNRMVNSEEYIEYMGEDTDESKPPTAGEWIVFLIIILVVMLPWIIAAWLGYKNYNKLKGWAKFAFPAAMFGMGGPLVAIAILYIGKEDGTSITFSSGYDMNMIQ